MSADRADDYAAKMVEYSNGEHDDEFITSVIHALKKSLDGTLPPIKELIMLSDDDLREMLNKGKGVVNIRLFLQGFITSCKQPPHRTDNATAGISVSVLPNASADDIMHAGNIANELASKNTKNPVHADFLVANGLESPIPENEPPAAVAQTAQRAADQGQHNRPTFPGDPLGGKLCPTWAEHSVIDGVSFFGSIFGFLGALLRWSVLVLAVQLPDKTNFASIGDVFNYLHTLFEVAHRAQRDEKLSGASALCQYERDFRAHCVHMISVNASNFSFSTACKAVDEHMFKRAINKVRAQRQSRSNHDSVRLQPAQGKGWESGSKSGKGQYGHESAFHQAQGKGNQSSQKGGQGGQQWWQSGPTSNPGKRTMPAPHDSAKRQKGQW